MMTLVRKWIREMFGFSRSETNGLIILLPLTGLVLFSAPAYRWMNPPEESDIRKDKEVLERLVKQLEEAEPLRRKIDEEKPVAPTLFPFDPNKATPEEMQRLGFSIRLSTRIANYRNKGGHFRVKEDLLKIYGMDSTFFRSLYPYIRVAERPARDVASRAENNRPPYQKKSVARFDLNTADSLQLKAVYGIGDKLAHRIIKYRERLGGFVRIEQLSEVFGLDSAVVGALVKVSFVDEKFTPNLLNINLLSERELSFHPYISKATAKAIVAYRFQHGDFKRKEDIRNVRILRQDEINRIMPYLADLAED